MVWQLAMDYHLKLLLIFVANRMEVISWKRHTKTWRELGWRKKAKRRNQQVCAKTLF